MGWQFYFLQASIQFAKKQFQQLEEQIAKLNHQKDSLEKDLADPSTYSNKDKFVQAEANYKKAADELGKLNIQYEQVFEKIMKLESK